MPTFKCNIFQRGVQSGKIGTPAVLTLAEQWDSFISRMAGRIHEGLERWLGPFSTKYPVSTTIYKLPDEYREKGVNALFDKDAGGKIYLNLEMLPLTEEDIPYILPYCIGNLLHEFMHANLADFIHRPPDGTTPNNWYGDSFYDEGYLDFMGEIVAADPIMWVDEVFGDFSADMFAGYVASNNRRLLNALGLSPGQEWSTPDFHIKRWAGQEYSRKIGGNLFRRFVEFKESKHYFYPVLSGPNRNYDTKTY